MIINSTSQRGKDISLGNLAKLNIILRCFGSDSKKIIPVVSPVIVCCFQKIYLLVFPNFSVNLRIETVKNDLRRSKKFTHLHLIINFLS